MQRRAAVLYAAFFFVIATGSYVGLGTVTEPGLSIEDPDHRLAVNDTFAVNGRTYTVMGVSAQTDENGNIVHSGTVEWTNDSATYRATWKNNSTVERGNRSFRVHVANDTDRKTVALVEQFDRTTILQNDSNAQNETVTANGTTYVVTTENGSESFVSASEYFPTPTVIKHGVDETFEFANNSTTIGRITNDSASVIWIAPRTNTVALGETTPLRTIVVRGGAPSVLSQPAGTNVTLHGKTFAVHYPNNSTALLTDNTDAYHHQVRSIEELYERIRGLWAVIVMSSIAGILLTGLAYLPTRA